MTGKCVKCGKILRLGIDGACKHCKVEICWDCWMAAGHECPSCGNFDGIQSAELPTSGKELK